MKRAAAFSVFAFSLLAVLSAGPAFAEATDVSPALQAVAAPAPVQPGCGDVLDLAALQPRGETCSLSEAQTPAPELKAFGKTCRCSCGSPCKTDADCGPGGRCTAGITCC